MLLDPARNVLAFRLFNTAMCNCYRKTGSRIEMLSRYSAEAFEGTSLSGAVYGLLQIRNQPPVLGYGKLALSDRLWSKAAIVPIARSPNLTSRPRNRGVALADPVP